MGIAAAPRVMDILDVGPHLEPVKRMRAIIEFGSIFGRLRLGMTRSHLNNMNRLSRIDFNKIMRDQ